ncbi:hypothetical protein SDC9_173099 [bioreactor metagenome]|uniref:Uncharacterized protein n=1 Tax=bioreactor metagenome TaxID=1076179 RepID=A0A645GG85_9ZZZZ
MQGSGKNRHYPDHFESSLSYEGQKNREDDADDTHPVKKTTQYENNCVHEDKNTPFSQPQERDCPFHDIVAAQTEKHGCKSLSSYHDHETHARCFRRVVNGVAKHLQAETPVGHSHKESDKSSHT